MARGCSDFKLSLEKPESIVAAIGSGKNSRHAGSGGMPLLVLLHDALVGLRVGVDLVFQRVELQLADAVELVDRKRHVRREREQAYHGERRGVVRGRNGGEHVGELGHRHHEHDPEGQRLHRHVVRKDGVPRIDKLIVNRDPEQYGETNDDKDRPMFEMLVAEELGEDSSKIQEEFFSLDD